MANGAEVLTLLKPEGGWVIRGDDFNSIEWHHCDPLTEEEFKAGFAKVDAINAKKEADALAQKAATEAKLAALGLSADDLKVLGLG